MAGPRRRRPLHERGRAEASGWQLKVDCQIALQRAPRKRRVNARSGDSPAGLAGYVEHLQTQRRIALCELEMIMGADVPAPFGGDMDEVIGRRRGRSAVDHGRVELDALDWRFPIGIEAQLMRRKADWLRSNHAGNACTA